MPKWIRVALAAVPSARPSASSHSQGSQSADATSAEVRRFAIQRNPRAEMPTTQSERLSRAVRMECGA